MGYWKSAMKLLPFVLALLVSMLAGNPAQADQTELMQRVIELEKRVAELEQQVNDLSGKDRWKDPILWQGLKKDMNARDVVKLLGKPARTEEQIFPTWYYHPTSKTHSYVWFDEGKVLGWELPDL